MRDEPGLRSNRHCRSVSIATRSFFSSHWSFEQDSLPLELNIPNQLNSLQQIRKLTSTRQHVDRESDPGPIECEADQSRPLLRSIEIYLQSSTESSSQDQNQDLEYRECLNTREREN